MVKLAKIGEWAFFVGVILAVVLGIFQQIFQQESTTKAFAILLVVLGIIVGFLNIAERETTPFLVAAIALMVAAFTGSTGLEIFDAFGDIPKAILNNIMLFVAPGVVIVALKTVLTIGADAKGKKK